MKTTMLIACLAILTGTASAQVYVKPHVTRDGTYVEGHQRTAPNSTKLDNYTTQGNVNPYTGQAGTVNPFTPPPQPTYPAQRQQQCGVTSNGQYVCR